MLTDLIKSIIQYLLIIILILAPIVVAIIACTDSGKKKQQQRPVYVPQQTQYVPQQYQYVPPVQSQNMNYTQPQTVQQEPTVVIVNPAAVQEEIDYRNAYQQRLLFTMNEWYNYMKLREIAEVKGYVICPKVRLLDIIEPRKGEKKYKTLLYKVQSKHVDFVICDKNMNIKGIIELDDSSHDRQDRKERDQFVDMILRSVGYKVIHTRSITVDILDLI